MNSRGDSQVNNVLELQPAVSENPAGSSRVAVHLQASAMWPRALPKRETMTVQSIPTDPVGSTTSLAGIPVSIPSSPILAQECATSNSAQPVRVLMLDDHVMFLQGLRSFLCALRADLLIDTAATMTRALQLLRSATYDLVLLDWHLDGGSGEKSVRRLRDSGCMGRIVILCGEMDSTLPRNCAARGISGFVPKTYSAEQLLSALGQVLDGKIFSPPEVQAQEDESIFGAPGAGADPRFAKLTSRQVEVYRAAARGLSNKHVARQLGIAETTVKSHLAIVYTVLGVKNRTEAAYQASGSGRRIL